MTTESTPAGLGRVAPLERRVGRLVNEGTKGWPMKRKTIGTKEVWYTRARFEWRDAAGMSGGRVWLCHCCGYWPSSDSTLPSKACGNCKEPWMTTVGDHLATPVTVKVTDYGYEMVAIGRPPNGSA